MSSKVDTAEQPFTVILGGNDEDDALTSHHVMAANPEAAIFVACEEAEITWACDAIVLAGHHDDLRKERGAVRVEE